MPESLIKIVVIVLALTIIFIIGSGFFGNNVSSREVESSNNGELWRDVDESSLVSAGERQIVPDSYRVLRLNKEILQTLLANAPLESKTSATQSESVISLPLPDGKFGRFRFVESPVMEEALQAKFPEIRTYLGQGIDEPGATVRFDYTPKGFHAMILSEKGSVFIDPFAKDDTDHYISYYKHDFQKSDRSFKCLVSDTMPNALEMKRLEDKLFPTENLVNNAGTLRTYRLAMAATGEYTQFHGGTVASALAAITTTMNRVNGVYERDLSVRMNLVANNNLIIYTDPLTDPYTNTSSDLIINQTNTDLVIGTANYDVGHLVGTGGGGVATLNSPCNATTKARGLTGSPSPVGDPFDIDYVAHELGHQFGGNHTFNASGAGTGSCNGNRASTAAYEPGSASTIQGYAGICGAQDLQRNSDDYFHIRSLEEMVAFITNPSTGGSCPVATANGNIAPVVTAAPACTIPVNTPFELTGSATDANGDSLTYTWEQYNLGASSNAVPNPDNGARPIFRSYKPTSSGATRTFPSLPYILNGTNIPPSTFTGTNPVGTVCAFGTCMTGELLPTVTWASPMQFQLTVRDNRAGGGGVRSAQTAVSVTNTSGPFAVTSQNSSVSYTALSTQTVTWNVANTTTAPVSCANVDILISTNGGATFSTLLANTPNDGSENVTIPNTPTTTARIKVKCSTSCFFDISNANFTILAPTAATASLGGRVLTAQGYGISNAIVVLTDTNGNSRTLRTNTFGFYSFSELPVGQIYVLTVFRKGYTFAQPTQTITLNEDFSEANFTANE
jgi:hypothetical protein